MFGFLIKKAFFDFWDHFLPMVLLNIFLIAVMAIPLGLPVLLFPVSELLGFIVLVIGILLTGIALSGASRFTYNVSRNQSISFSDFIGYLKEGWKHGLIFSVIIMIAGFFAWFTFPFYSSIDNVAAVAALAFLFWTYMALLLSIQYFFPVLTQIKGDGKFKTVARKMFLIFFDNPGFSIGIALLTLIIFALGFITAFIMFGFGGILLLQQVALKLRLYKYDYLEENPDAKRNKIPWSAILLEERERVGKRSLRGMIFPWKD